MPNPTYEQYQPPKTEASLETPTEASNLKPLEESENVSNTCQLGFQEQCRVVWEGLKKGVKYDGCTAVPDFDFGADCCGEHDAHYQLGDISRAEADARMRACIRKKGYVVLPWAYWLGVRLFAGGVWKKYRKKEQNENSDDTGPGGLA